MYPLCRYTVHWLFGNKFWKSDRVFLRTIVLIHIYRNFILKDSFENLTGLVQLLVGRPYSLKQKWFWPLPVKVSWKFSIAFGTTSSLSYYPQLFWCKFSAWKTNNNLTHTEISIPTENFCASRKTIESTADSGIPPIDVPKIKTFLFYCTGDVIKMQIFAVYYMSLSQDYIPSKCFNAVF